MANNINNVNPSLTSVQREGANQEREPNRYDPRVLSMVVIIKEMAEAMAELSLFDLSLLQAFHKSAETSKELANESHRLATALVSKMERWDLQQKVAFFTGLGLSSAASGTLAARGSGLEMVSHGLQGTVQFNKALTGTMEGLATLEKRMLESELGLKDQATNTLMTSSSSLFKQMSDGLDVQGEMGRKIHELLKAMRDAQILN